MFGKLLIIGILGLVLVALAALPASIALIGASAKAGSASARGYLSVAPPALPASPAAPFVGCSTANFALATNYYVGGDPDSVAVGDFNHDSNLDLAVAD